MGKFFYFKKRNPIKIKINKIKLIKIRVRLVPLFKSKSLRIEINVDFILVFNGFGHLGGMFTIR